MRKLLSLILTCALTWGFPLHVLADDSDQSLVNIFAKGLIPNEYAVISQTSVNNNNVTTTIWTVDATHTFYLHSFFNQLQEISGNAAGSCYLEVTNSGGTLQYYISQLYTASITSSLFTTDSRTINIPYAIPSGYIVKLVASTTVYCNASLYGWEI